MKNKFIMVLVLCAALILPVFGLTACENAGTDKTDTAQESVLPTDNDTKPNENENNDNETDQNKPIVITAETDFDALESDKVSEEEFYKCFYELYRLMPGGGGGYWAFGFEENVTMEMSFYKDKAHNFERLTTGIVKRDGFNMQISNPNYPTITQNYIIADDLKSAYIEGEYKSEEWIKSHKPDENYPKEMMDSLTYTYDENEHKYVLYKNHKLHADCKIKNDRIVYLKLYDESTYENEFYPEEEKYETIVLKLYDFGTTKINFNS